jgi:hypothetical protein
MKNAAARYAIEFLTFLLLFLAAFLGYHLRSEPTKFIYYNF